MDLMAQCQSWYDKLGEEVSLDGSEDSRDAPGDSGRLRGANHRTPPDVAENRIIANIRLGRRGLQDSGRRRMEKRRNGD